MQNQSIKITPLLDTLHLEKIDDSIYFSKKYSNYISNSRLSLINPEQDGSPEKFFSGFKSVYSPSFYKLFICKYMDNGMHHGFGVYHYFIY